MAGSKGSKYYDVFIDYSISLEHKRLGNILDKYKFELLVAIRDSGSLKAAAEKLGVSYRKVWNNIEDIEKTIGFKLVNRSRGGTQGGKTTLTEDGLNLLEAHASLRKEFDQAIYSITKEFFKNVNK